MVVYQCWLCFAKWSVVIFSLLWLKHALWHWPNKLSASQDIVSGPLTDRNSRSQIKPAKSDSVPETSDRKDSPSTPAAPTEQSGSSPDLGKPHSHHQNAYGLKYKDVLKNKLRWQLRHLNAKSIFQLQTSTAENHVSTSALKHIRTRASLLLWPVDFFVSTLVYRVIKNQPPPILSIELDHNSFKCKIAGCLKSFRKASLLHYHMKYYHAQSDPSPPRCVQTRSSDKQNLETPRRRRTVSASHRECALCETFCFFPSWHAGIIVFVPQIPLPLWATVSQDTRLLAACTGSARPHWAQRGAKRTNTSTARCMTTETGLPRKQVLPSITIIPSFSSAHAHDRYSAY